MSFDIFDIASSGMNAQRVKLDSISSNIANVNTTRNPDGTPGVYVKKDVTFKAIYDEKIGRIPSMPSGNLDVGYSKSSNEPFLIGGISFGGDNHVSSGVEVATVEDAKNPYKVVYDPSHPDANEDGYVTLPNINVVEEMVNMVVASKAYEANATVAETTKTMINKALQI